MKNLFVLALCLVSVVYSNPYRNIGLYRGYVGCFVDDRNHLMLKHRKQVLHRNSLEKCRHHCRGFRYLGLQAGRWCLCGNRYYSRAYPQASELECNYRCPGEPNRMCGGSWRNAIYEVCP
ncbi:sialate:O-sulfotransferase 2-like [Mytilus trossulus]|uniref:sialate:O-sulfotransferase 2-like n=1 Tax=Mytilus trossulus TaxID=6551 RepID=UPI0030073F8B